jgi:hypothetical protein
MIVDHQLETRWQRISKRNALFARFESNDVLDER